MWIRMDGEGATCWFLILKHFWLLQRFLWGVLEIPGIRSAEGNRKPWSVGATVPSSVSDQFAVTGFREWLGNTFIHLNMFRVDLLISEVLNYGSFAEVSRTSSMMWSCVVVKGKTLLGHVKFLLCNFLVIFTMWGEICPLNLTLWGWLGSAIMDLSLHSICNGYIPSFRWPWPLWKEMA